MNDKRKKAKNIKLFSNRNIGTKIEESGSLLKKGVPFFRYVIGGVVVNFVVIFFAIIFKKNLPPEIPLYYGLPDGISQIAQSEMFFIPSFFALVIIIFNTSLSFLTKDVLLKRALVISSLLITVLASITAVKIFFLVGKL